MWWGSTDPRLSLGAVAKKLEIPASTVRDRLRGWQASGFLPGTEVLPSPGLFGVGLAGTGVRVDDPSAKPQVLHDLSLVDGVLTTIDHVGPWIALSLANEGPRELERRRQLVERLRGVDAVVPCVPLGAPPCSADPTPLDWRILAAMRRTRNGSISEGAKLAGVSAKTFAKRYENLIAARAVWVLPLFDFTKWSGGAIVRFIVDLEARADNRQVSEEVRDRVVDVIQVFLPSSAVAPGMPEDYLEVWVHLASAALADEVDRAIRAAAGVTSTAMFFPRSFGAYANWFDARVAEKLPRQGGTPG